jgi:hypothetical protein
MAVERPDCSICVIQQQTAVLKCMYASSFTNSEVQIWSSKWKIHQSLQFNKINFRSTLCNTFKRLVGLQEQILGLRTID